LAEGKTGNPSSKACGLLIVKICPQQRQSQALEEQQPFSSSSDSLLHSSAMLTSVQQDISIDENIGMLIPKLALKIRKTNPMTFNRLLASQNRQVRRRIILKPILYLLVPIFAMGQSASELEVLNSYVDFMNECVHGLTVAQIIFVNYNQDLNNYVDVASHKLNSHITNKEMGESIFDNPNINTKDDKVSALKLSQLTRQKSTILNRKV